MLTEVLWLQVNKHSNKPGNILTKIAKHWQEQSNHRSTRLVIKTWAGTSEVLVVDCEDSSQQILAPFIEFLTGLSIRMSEQLTDPSAEQSGWQDSWLIHQLSNLDDTAADWAALQIFIANLLANLLMDQDDWVADWSIRWASSMTEQLTDLSAYQSGCAWGSISIPSASKPRSHHPSVLGVVDRNFCDLWVLVWLR